MLKHFKHGRRYQFLTKMGSVATNNAELEGTKGSVDGDGTIISKFLDYIQNSDIISDFLSVHK